jgi:hypothetical protein
VTDRTYADVSIDLDAPTGEPALVVLRDEQGKELEVGGAACPGPFLSAHAASLHVERTGPAVTWSVPGGPAGSCATGVRGDARVSVGVRGPASVAESIVRNLRVVRLSSP